MARDWQNLAADEQAVVLAVGVTAAPLNVADLTAVTGLDAGHVMAAGDALIVDDWLTDDPAGYGPTELAVSAEISHARRVELSRTIARILATDRPLVASRLFANAGDQQSAFDVLADAALRSGIISEETSLLAEAALAASVDVSPPPEDLGHLHMVVGKYHRSIGDSDAANDWFASAALELKGTERIDALGYCAATADDRQRPQEAEHWLGTAQFEAVTQGEWLKYGSLLTLHARTLSRIGFPSEADHALSKGKALLIDPNPIQHALAGTNEAWILLDRGYARQAESAFAILAFEAERAGDLDNLAFHRVYQARSLYANGHQAQADEILEGVEAGGGALLFLKRLALTEGAGWFEDWELARQRASTLLETTLTEVPQWENIARYHLARALLGVRDLDGALAELTNAMTATPPGADGWRWRMRCQELRLMLDHAQSGTWDRTTAENLTDELLVARWFDTACDLMINRATIELDPELARQAAGLAESIGNPTLAIRAAQGMLAEPQSHAIVREAKHIHGELASPERERWADLPHVAAALGADPPEPTEGQDTLVDELNETLQAIGLRGVEDLLTPAQRHQHGLVRRVPAQRSRRWLAVAAAAIGVVALSVGTSFALRDDPPPLATVTVTVTRPTTTTTTIPLTVEQTHLTAPESKLAGSTVDGGDSARTGVTDAAGLETVGGWYWKFPASDVIRSAPVTYGSLVYVGSSDHFVYAVDQTTGDSRWLMETGGPVLGTAAVGKIALSEGAIGQGGIDLLTIGSDDGFLWARNAVLTEGSALWKYEIGVPVRTTPLFSGNLVILAGGDGRVHAIQGASAEATPEWIYPQEGEVAPFETSPALSNGVVYAGDSDGVLHVIDAASGDPICQFDSRAEITTPPSIVDGVVYFGTSLESVYLFAEGTCPGGITSITVIPTAAFLNVIAYGNQLSMPDGVAMYGFELPSGASADRFYPAGATISSPSIVANDIMYFGDQNGLLHAVDATTLDGKWTFATDERILSAPAIGDGVVFVTSGSTLYALGPPRE